MQPLMKLTRQPFQGLAAVVRTPGQCVGLTRLGTSSSVPVESTGTRLDRSTPPAPYPTGFAKRNLQDTFPI